jgi:hypothetical protein
MDGSGVEDSEEEADIVLASPVIMRDDGGGE